MKNTHKTRQKCRHKHEIRQLKNPILICIFIAEKKSSLQHAWGKKRALKQLADWIGFDNVGHGGKKSGSRPSWKKLPPPLVAYGGRERATCLGLPTPYALQLPVGRQRCKSSTFVALPFFPPIFTRTFKYSVCECVCVVLSVFPKPRHQKVLLLLKKSQN